MNVDVCICGAGPAGWIATVAADETAYASLRTQAQCMAMGQAAGTAAALCVRHGCDVADIDAALLRDQLRANHVIL